MVCPIQKYLCSTLASSGDAESLTFHVSFSKRVWSTVNSVCEVQDAFGKSLAVQSLSEKGFNIEALNNNEGVKCDSYKASPVKNQSIKVIAPDLSKRLNIVIMFLFLSSMLFYAGNFDKRLLHDFHHTLQFLALTTLGVFLFTFFDWYWCPLGAGGIFRSGDITSQWVSDYRSKFWTALVAGVVILVALVHHLSCLAKTHRMHILMRYGMALILGGSLFSMVRGETEVVISQWHVAVCVIGLFAASRADLCKKTATDNPFRPPATWVAYIIQPLALGAFIQATSVWGFSNIIQNAFETLAIKTFQS